MSTWILGTACCLAVLSALFLGKVPGSCSSACSGSRSMCALLQRLHCCTGHVEGASHPSVYVAPLPAKYNTDLLYDAETTTVSEVDRIFCGPSYIAELLANPLGRMADYMQPDLPLRESFYYGLAVHVHMQLLRSPLRVLDPAAADIIIVPVYLTQLIHPHAITSCNRALSEEQAAELVRDFWAESAQLLPLLGRKPHWLFVADLELNLRKGCGSSWGTDFLCHERAAQLIVTSAEPWAGGHRSGSYHWLASSQPLHAGSLSVPFIGHVHFGARHYGVDVFQANKTHLMTMAFKALRTPDTRLREVLLGQCSALPHMCLAPDMGTPLGINVTTVISAYAAANYCIQPYGDTPTRQAFYDCVALGTTIPVVFDPHLLDFLPFSHVIPYKKFSIVVSEQEVVEGSAQSWAERLPSPGSETYDAMLQELKVYHHVFQYAVAPDHRLVAFESLLIVHEGNDALTMAFKGVVHNACKRGLLEHPGCQGGREGRDPSPVPAI